jgi:chromosomal replication initiator protein
MNPLVSEIQEAVADWYRLDLADMKSDRRWKSIVRPRQLAMYLAREMTNRSYPEIGRIFGGRDHTTVIHAVRVIKRLLAYDAELENAHYFIRKRLIEMVALRMAGRMAA